MRLIVSTLLALLSAPAWSVEWEPVLDEGGVSGYARAVPGSRVLEFRSVVVVDARIEVVGAVLRDVEGLKRPGSSCTEARVLERSDQDHYTFYVAYDLPFPFDDRVAVVQVASRYDLERGRVTAELRGLARPPVRLPAGAVPITDFEAQFVVEYLGRERTGVVYTSRIDPAGHIPAFLANRAARDSLLESVRALRRAVRNPAYVRAAASSADAALAERLLGDRAAVERVVANRLGELIPDAALVTRLAAEPAVSESFVSGDGRIGAVLLLGWGSAGSRREALRLLLLEALGRHSDDAEAVQRFVSGGSLLDQVLSGQAGDREVASFIASARHR